LLNFRFTAALILLSLIPFAIQVCVSSIFIFKQCLSCPGLAVLTLLVFPPPFFFLLLLPLTVVVFVFVGAAACGLACGGGGCP
jgi:hypothetical protein